MDTILAETESFIRKSLSEEQLAVAVYLQRKQLCEKYATYCQSIGAEKWAETFNIMSNTFEDILSEEEIHIGQLREMLSLLGVSDANEIKGTAEAKETALNVARESFLTITKKLEELL